MKKSINSKWIVNDPGTLEQLNNLLVKGAEAKIVDGELIFSYDEEKVQLSKTRNAGRKSADERWVASFNAFCELYKSHKLKEEIMEEIRISRATYYRYKKLYDETEGVFDFVQEKK